MGVDYYFSTPIFFIKFYSLEYYLYRHVRNDNKTVFYIGIGKKKFVKSNHIKYKGEYQRAYSTTGRNAHWSHIVNKTSYTVEIVIDDLNFETIYLKEIEFIKLYGRKDLGTGSLVNMTSGGLGYKNPNVSIRKIKSLNLQSQTGKNSRASKNVFMYDLHGRYIREFESILDAGQFCNISSVNISNVCNNKQLQAGGYLWSLEYKEFITPPDKLRGYYKVYEYDYYGKYTRMWNSILECATYHKTTRQKIVISCLELKTVKSHNGIRFRYYLNVSGIEVYKIPVANNSISIGMYDLNDVLLKSYNSISHATQEYPNLNRKLISQCINGKRTNAYGYIWKRINNL